MSRLEIWGVALPGEVGAGADLAALVAAAEPGLADGDVVVVTSKVVSKAEGRVVACPPDPEGREAARRAAVDGETVRVVAARGATRIVETRHGFVLAAAGVDASNTSPGTLVLLPVDADASARRIRAGLRERLGVDVAVVVSDTFGRAWRRGLVDVAVGAAGIAPLRDYRGRADAYGNPLVVTEMADVDALAAAAELVKGKLAGVPVAVVRGLRFAPSDDGVRPLVRPAEEDLFRMGTAEAAESGRATFAAELAAATEPWSRPGAAGAPPTGAGDRTVRRVLRELAGEGDTTIHYQPERGEVDVACRPSDDLVAVGLVTARVVAALLVAGVPARVTRTSRLVADTGHSHQVVATIAVR